MPIPPHVEENVRDLITAFTEQKIVVMEVTDTKDENKVKYAVCSVHENANGKADLIPLAIMVDDNPFERYKPPELMDDSGIVATKPSKIVLLN